MPQSWPEYLLLENVISDRGSRYAVGLGRVENLADMGQLLSRHTSKKKYRNGLLKSRRTLKSFLMT